MSNPCPTALITGARRGIGKAIALGMARAGFDVAINDLNSSPELDAAVAEARALGVKAAAIAGDVSASDRHSEIIDAAEKVLGPLTTLVNNAGVSVASRGDLLDVSAASYDRCQSVNTRGVFFLTQAFAKRLLARERPASLHHSIVTITSANAIGVSINRGEYCVSKAAASMVSKLFAARLSNEGIGVYEIQPGFIETDMTAPSKARYDKLIEDGLTVIKRFGTADEVAKIAVTLATGGLPYTSGQAIAADAGLLTVRY
jgi:NAD(P)-dependent dehydrogenase (short-subunit alcohol dehydrogenase family)